MSAFPRCVALCLLAAAALLATVSAEVTIGQTYSGDVSSCPASRHLQLGTKPLQLGTAAGCVPTARLLSHLCRRSVTEPLAAMAESAGSCNP
jgi:hypothetical protein